MGNFTSVTISNGETIANSHTGAELGTPPTRQGMLNDFAANQPKNLSVTASGGEMVLQEHGVQRVDAPTISGLPGSLSTLQNSFGAPIGDMSLVDPKTTTIMVAGSRATVESAINQGLLTRSSSGRLDESPLLKSLNAKYLEPAAAPEVVNLVDDGHRNTLNEMYKRVGSSQTTAFIAQAISSTITGKPCDALVADFSQSINAKQDTVVAWANEYINDLYDGAISQAARIGGIDAGEFSAFVQTLDKSTQTNLMMAAHLGDKSALQYVIQKFKKG